MSVIAGRACVVLSGALTMVGVVWFLLLWGQGGPEAFRAPTALLIASVLAVLGAAVFISSALIVFRFVEATIDDHHPDGSALAIRSVWRPRRVIPLSYVSRAVVITGLLLPARSSGADPVVRLLLHVGDGQTVAFTPHDRYFAETLQTRGVPLDIDHDRLTLGQAAKRHPGTVSVGERVTGWLPWAAIVVGVGVLIWAVIGLLR